jgi:sec-independent protein translocase protein TatB
MPAPLVAFFGLGTTEIIVILVVALIVIGPGKLPEVARALGKGLREFRKTADDLQREITREDHDDARRPPRPIRGSEAAPPVVMQDADAAAPVTSGITEVESTGPTPRRAPGAVARGEERETEGEA